MVTAVDTMFSALTAAASAALANELLVNEAGTNKKVTAQQISDLLGVEKKVVTSLYQIASATGTEVTALRAALAVGTYRFQYKLIVRSSAAGTGPGFGLNFSGTQTALVAVLHYQGTGTGTSSGTMDDANTGAGSSQMREGSAARTVTTTSPNMNVITAVGAADVDCFVTIIGVIVVSATGNLELWANAEAGGATIDVRVGSALMLTRMA